MPSLPLVGTDAPDFTLPSTAGENVTLSFLGGNNFLLAFFPAAFTSVCTAEVGAFPEELSRFRQSGTIVLPISVDAVPSLKAFKAKEQMKVDLLSDFKREVSRLYGTLNEGVVRWTHAEDTPASRRENSEIVEQISKLN